ncbi:MAG: hypothetical protein O2890_01780 [Cyanobacteria bacterium]|nr:hypothetical protein [Cyanobacteriota bacterium]MDA0865149.1 hypothetical protein [Cyanobacteriota bacterium]
MPKLNDETLNAVQGVLCAYGDAYGLTDSLEEWRAIAGSILSVKAQAEALVIRGAEWETWVEVVITAFQAQDWSDYVVSAGEQAIAAQVKDWRVALRHKVTNTLTAYVQQTGLQDLPIDVLRQAVVNILPIVEDGQVTRDEVAAVIDHLQAQFDWSLALKQVVDPIWVELAEKTIRCLQNDNLKVALRDTVNAYIAAYKPTLVEMGTSLVERAMAIVLANKGEFDLDVALDPETQSLIIKQVSFKLKILEASPPPSKTATEIVDDLQDEIDRYRQSQTAPSSYIPDTTTTEGSTSASVLGPSLGIGITLGEPTTLIEPPPDTND